MFSTKRINFAPIFLIIGIFLTPCAFAQTVDEVVPMHYGRWAITDTSVPHYITLNPDGSYTNDPELVMLDPPAAGVYRITGLPPNVPVTVIVTVVNPMQRSGPGHFNLDNFVTVVPNSDLSGETLLTLGARAQSLPGAGYDDDVYTGQLNLTVNF